MFVAMSGGVDSSVSALLLKNQGANITGVTFKLFESEESKKAIFDAKKVCDIIGIDHLVLDLTSEFKKNVIDYFVNEYCKGRTPNPCVICNKKIKFGLAIEKLKNLGIKKLATGHYSKVLFWNGRYCVKKMKNSKDQSYYFCLLDQSQLEKIVTPVSDFNKDYVRKLASENGIPVWNKKDSQDICFIKGSYKNFLGQIGVKSPPGNFVDEYGNILGSHNGIQNYTFGQRKGLGISLGERAYVKRIDPITNNIIISKKFDVIKFEISNINFVSFEKYNIPENVQICVRYNSFPVNSNIKINNDDTVLVTLEYPLSTVCPGQFAVGYVDDLLAFGGVISKTIE